MRPVCVQIESQNGHTVSDSCDVTGKHKAVTKAGDRITVWFNTKLGEIASVTLEQDRNGEFLLKMRVPTDCCVRSVYNRQGDEGRLPHMIYVMRRRRALVVEKVIGGKRVPLDNGSNDK